jgi:hypothetical protein
MLRILIFLKSMVAFKKFQASQVLVAYACNPSYSGGRDQEDGGSKPDQVKSS